MNVGMRDLSSGSSGSVRTAEASASGAAMGHKPWLVVAQPAYIGRLRKCRHTSGSLLAENRAALQARLDLGNKK